jgi:hypothetical protein
MPLTKCKNRPGLNKTETAQVQKDSGLMVILLDLDMVNQKKLVVM